MNVRSSRAASRSSRAASCLMKNKVCSGYGGRRTWDAKHDLGIAGILPTTTLKIALTLVKLLCTQPLARSYHSCVDETPCTA